MHGVIFCELKAFAENELGANAWNDMVRQGTDRPKFYSSLQVYPDEELTVLVGKVAERMGSPIALLLTSFGKHLAKVFSKGRVHLYLSSLHSCPVVKQSWGFFDLLEQTESNIHSIIQITLAESSPACLNARRINAHAVEMEYRSPRRLCALARGLIEGFAEIYNTPIGIQETECTHRGDERCLFVVTRTSA